MEEFELKERQRGSEIEKGHQTIYNSLRFATIKLFHLEHLQTSSCLPF